MSNPLPQHPHQEHVDNGVAKCGNTVRRQTMVILMLSLSLMAALMFTFNAVYSACLLCTTTSNDAVTDSPILSRGDLRGNLISSRVLNENAEVPVKQCNVPTVRRKSNVNAYKIYDCLLTTSYSFLHTKRIQVC